MSPASFPKYMLKYLKHRAVICVFASGEELQCEMAVSRLGLELRSVFSQQASTAPEPPSRVRPGGWETRLYPQGRSCSPFLSFS